MRPKRSNDDLSKAFFHLSYELQKLKYCGELLAPPQNLNLPDNVFAVLMESFLIHARNLNQFFHGWDMKIRNQGRVYREEAIAEDFFMDQGESWKKPSEGLSKVDKQKIDKQLAHITYEREITTRASWDFPSILNCLTEDFDSFARSVHPEKVRLKVRDSLPGEYFFVDIHPIKELTSTDGHRKCMIYRQADGKFHVDTWELSQVHYLDLPGPVWARVFDTMLAGTLPIAEKLAQERLQSKSGPNSNWFEA